ncbi:hypothetical protein SCA6_001196 [Theobroma cacao]
MKYKTFVLVPSMSVFFIKPKQWPMEEEDDGLKINLVEVEHVPIHVRATIPSPTCEHLIGCGSPVEDNNRPTTHVACLSHSIIARRNTSLRSCLQSKTDELKTLLRTKGCRGQWVPDLKSGQQHIICIT